MIDQKIKNELLQKFPSIKEEEQLADKTYIKLGGPAELYLESHDQQEIEQVIGECLKSDISYFILGKGCNIVFEDEGYRGLILRIVLTDMKMLDQTTMHVGAGATLLDVIFFAHRNGLVGMQGLSGVPSSVGGAIFGNAGASGVEMGDFVETVDLLEINKEKKLIAKKTITKEEANFRYRHSRFKDQKNAIILGATLKLEKGKTQEALDEIEEYLEKRAKAQPLSYPSAGCVFKNPPGESAGMLIDKAGLNGYAIGGMSVSNKHGNFIVNNGTGTFEEYMQLVKHVKSVIKEKTGIELEEEHIIVQNKKT